MMRTGSALLLGWVLCLAGCSAGQSTAQISGEVKKANGQAMDNAAVVFFPANGPSVVARTDSSGAFTAQVAVGPAKIAVMDATDAPADNSPAAANAKPKAPRIKAKFSSAETSGLQTNVGQQKEKLVLTVE